MMIWTCFLAVIFLFLALDLGIFNKKSHEISVKEATVWTGIWTSVALLFSLGIYFIYSNQVLPNPENLSPGEAVMKYISGYLIELSLSVDNIFVIAVLFRSFQIPPKYQHRVLFFGILGAIIFRALTILFGLALIHMFSWIIYLFGAFLLYTAISMLRGGSDEISPRETFAYRLILKLIPISKGLFGQKFFIRRNGVFAATPLFVALIVIEITDILFALDSIPAVLAITTDAFLIFSSNILAILGLRSMYFFLANLLNRFEHLHYSLVVILIFVGLKMIASHHIPIPDWLSLTVIVAALLVGILTSYLALQRKRSSAGRHRDEHSEE